MGGEQQEEERKKQGQPIGKSSQITPLLLQTPKQKAPAVRLEEEEESRGGKRLSRFSLPPPWSSLLPPFAFVHARKERDREWSGGGGGGGLFSFVVDVVSPSVPPPLTIYTAPTQSRPLSIRPLQSGWPPSSSSPRPKQSDREKSKYGTLRPFGDPSSYYYTVLRKSVYRKVTFRLERGLQSHRLARFSQAVFCRGRGKLADDTAIALTSLEGVE